MIPRLVSLSFMVQTYHLLTHDMAALDDILSTLCPSHELIDDSLRAWLELVSKFRDSAQLSDNEIEACSESLVDSPLFRDNENYVRHQISFSLLQEEGFSTVYAIASFLLSSGKRDTATFRCMVAAGCFPRLLELLGVCRGQDLLLHRLLMDLLYEMSRAVHLKPEDLKAVDEAFIFYLLNLVEPPSEDSHDLCHDTAIRVLVSAG
jgi:hypothetical protein